MSSGKWWDDVAQLRKTLRDANTVIARVGWDRSLESVQKWVQEKVDEMDKAKEHDDLPWKLE